MSEQSVLFRDDQEVQSEDLSNIGQFASDSIDHLVGDGVEGGRKFWGFPCTITSATEVNVGAGRVYFGSGDKTGTPVYYRDDDGGVAVNLFSVRPVASLKSVLLVATPVTIQTNSQARDFLINAETLETEPTVVAMESRRQANIGAIAGDENVTPQDPVVDANSVAFARVILGPAGVLSITYLEANRIRSTALAHQRLDANDLYLQKIGSRIDTLGSDINSLANSINGLASAAIVQAMAFDLAKLKANANLPSSYSYYAFDPLLTTANADLSNAAYLAKIDEGVRFADAQVQVAQAQLSNQYDPSVKVADNFVLPAYTAVKRISVVGNDAQMPIANYPFQTIQTVQKTRVRTVTHWGTAFDVCTNSAFWQSGTYDPLTGIFVRASDGATFKAALDLNASGGTLPYAYTGDGLLHVPVRLQQFWTDDVTETYWDNVTVQGSASGSMVAQTFLNTQDGYLTSLNLFFASVAAAGDVTVLLTQCNDDGSPNYKKVIARTVVPVQNLVTYPNATPVPMALPFLDKGDRFGIAVITPGNHSVCQVVGNKYGQGSFFSSTDGVYSQGDLTKDMAFEALFCSFNASRIEVSMAPLTLAGGIANVKLNLDTTLPDGTTVTHYILNNGVWVPMGVGTALLGLPALVQYKIVLTGTTDSMPGFGVGPNSEITTSRPRGDFDFITAARTLPSGVTTTKVTVKLRVEGWSALHHTVTVRLLYGAGYGTAKTYDVLLSNPAPEDPLNALEQTYTFNLPSAIGTYKLEAKGTTDTVLNCFHLASIYDIAA